MIKFIGDISKTDALVLKEFAEKANNILEFGVGGSTQVLANYAQGEVTSIETNIDWIEKTRCNLEILKIKKSVYFQYYGDFMLSEHTQSYDMIFNDGVDHLRKDFGLYAFSKLLKPNGVLLFHDQRRTGDVYNMVEVIKNYSAYIECVEINYLGSNITIIYKRDIPLFYEDWNVIEQKKDWQIGQGDIPQDELEKLKK